MDGNILKNGILIALVIIILVLGVIAFSFYSQTQGQASDLKSKQTALDTLNTSYSQLSGTNTALQTNYNKMMGQYQQLNESYIDVSNKYETLKNQSDSAQIKIGDFLENGPAIAYTYSIVVDRVNNSTNQIVTAMAYNVGQQDANNVVASITVATMNNTSMLTKTIPLVRSMGKGKAVWIIDNLTTVQRVWVGVSS